MQLTRTYKQQLFFKRLEFHKDFFLSFYAKKKSNKKGLKMVKNLKKMFNRKEDKDMILSQIQIFFNRCVKESNSLYLSIAIRAFMIINQIMGLSTVKDEDSGEKVFKQAIASNKTKIDELVKKFRAVNK